MGKSLVPANYEGVVNLITREYAGLSSGYQQIARFLPKIRMSLRLNRSMGLQSNAGFIR
jgi:hypothetical protein